MQHLRHSTYIHVTRPMDDDAGGPAPKGRKRASTPAASDGSPAKKGRKWKVANNTTPAADDEGGDREGSNVSGKIKEEAGSGDED